jgi:diacylglycerol O-acyltransferase / wax synthase
MTAVETPRWRSFLDRRLGFWADVGVIVAVLLVWQALRLPIEGSVRESVAHARSWFAFEHDLHVAIEPSVIRFVHRADVAGVVTWAYDNIHLVALFAFIVGVRLLTPWFYPRVRTAYVLMHIPALLLIAAYPTAPPKWLAEIPFHETLPTDADLSAGGDLLLNKTAAIVSLHFGYPLFIALVLIRLAPRSPWAWLSLLYPALVFFLIVGSGNHFVLDAAVGCACVVFALLGARLLHGPARVEPAEATVREAVTMAAAVGLLAFAVDALAAGRVQNGAWLPALVAAVLGILLAFVRTPVTQPR